LQRKKKKKKKLYELAGQNTKQDRYAILRLTKTAKSKIDDKELNTMDFSEGIDSNWLGVKDLYESITSIQNSASSTKSANKSVPLQRKMIKSAAGRSAILSKETTQISNVIRHPAFKKSPLLTITEHLKNTVAVHNAISNK